jgi:hypothetical protein
MFVLLAVLLFRTRVYPLDSQTVHAWRKIFVLWEKVGGLLARRGLSTEVV